jgi:hypothetical protein
VEANADELKKPISLKEAVSSNLLGHIEALEWLDNGKLLVRANEMTELIDFDSPTQDNVTLFEMEPLVSY